MNTTDDLERHLRSMLADTAARREPDGLFASVMASTSTMRQRPGVLAGLRAGDVGAAPRTYSALATAAIVGLLLVALALAVALVGSQLVTPPKRVPVFVATGPMTAARADATAVRLADGRVLIVGGWTTSGSVTGVPSAEIYDPISRTFTATGPMHEGRVSPSATLLADGRVLVAGGFPIHSMNVGPATALASAEIYDPTAGTFSVTGPMAEGRGDHIALRVPSGEVLVVGGVGGLRSTGSNSAELIEPSHVEEFDPAKGTFTRLAIPNFAGVTDAVLLDDGDILGFRGESILRYDPVRVVGYGIANPGRAGAAAITLRDGRVVVGSTLDHGTIGVQSFDPATDRFGPVTVVWSGGLGRVNELLAAFETPDGDVVMIGGSGLSTGGRMPSVALYDPATGTVIAADPISGGSLDGAFTATALADGSILIAGGALIDPTGLITPTRGASLWVPDPGVR